MWRNPPEPDWAATGLLNQHGEPPTGREILAIESVIPMSVMTLFLEFLVNHRLPNGERTTLPVLSSEEFGLFSRPYNDWAPSPFNLNMVRSESAASRFMHTASGLRNMFDLQSVFTGRPPRGPEYVEQEVKFTNSRLWAGLVPLSDRRWRDMGLDDPDNFEQAVAHLAKFAAFLYPNLPETQLKMRDLYNQLYDDLERFDSALEAHHRVNPGPRGQRAKTIHLWTDYFFTHVSFITARAHAWVAKHLEPLRAQVLEEIAQSAPGPPGHGYTPEQRALADDLHEAAMVMGTADYAMLIPLMGYRNELPQWRHLSSTPGVNWLGYDGRERLYTYPLDITQRGAVYSKRQKYLVRQDILRNVMSSLAVGADSDTWTAEGLLRTSRLLIQSHAEARRELRGEPVPIREEMWVWRLRVALEPSSATATPESAESSESSEPPVAQRQPSSWGLVGYRLCYGHSADEWSEFLESFRNDVNDWGEGVAGAEGIKAKSEIRWIDGRDHGIAEGDVDAARRHFRSMVDGDGLRDLSTISGFLVADKASIDSYLSKPELPGQDLVDDADLGPFIVVASDDFRPEDARDRASPGYDGTVRVMGSVLFDDLWPSLGGRTISLSEIWPIAAVNPSCIYMGPTGEHQIMNWNLFDLVRMEVMTTAQDWAREGRLRPSAGT